MIISTLAMTMIVTLLGTLMMARAYEASTTLRIATAPAGSLDYVTHDTDYAERLVNTYKNVVANNPAFLRELEQKLGLTEVPKIEVAIPANTELLQIKVEARDPVLAARTANILAELLIDHALQEDIRSEKTAQKSLSAHLAQLEDELDQARRRSGEVAAQFPGDADTIAAARRAVEMKEQAFIRFLEQYDRARIAAAMRADRISVVDPAVPPERPSKPRPELNLILGLLVGLIGGIGIAFLFHHLDTTLYTTEQIEAATGLPALAEIPSIRQRKHTGLSDGGPPHVEALRRLRTSLFTLGNVMPLRALLITSPGPSEGKSTVVANLAVALAQAGHRVIVVDANLRLPILHQVFHLPNRVGLANVLTGEASLDEAVQDSGMPGIHVLTSGSVAAHPLNSGLLEEQADVPSALATIPWLGSRDMLHLNPDLLASSRLGPLIEDLRERFTMVLLDTPALLPVGDAAVLASAADGVALVVARGQTRAEEVRAAVQQLASAHAKPIGIVVNHAEQDSRHHQQARRSPVGTSDARELARSDGHD